MSNANNRIKSQKQWPAIVAALSITLIVGLTILALGLNALFNTNVVPAKAASLTDQTSRADQATIDQLQSLVDQYQARETQYQTELQQAADQLSQSNTQVQQYQDLITALQNAGVIQISPDGWVFVGRGAGNGN